MQGVGFRPSEGAIPPWPLPSLHLCDYQTFFSVRTVSKHSRSNLCKDSRTFSFHNMYAGRSRCWPSTRGRCGWWWLAGRRRGRRSSSPWSRWRPRCSSWRGCWRRPRRPWRRRRWGPARGGRRRQDSLAYWDADADAASTVWPRNSPPSKNLRPPTRMNIRMHIR